MHRAVPRYRFHEDEVDGVVATLHDGQLRAQVRLVDISSSGVALILEDAPDAAEPLLRRWKREGRLTLVLSGPRVEKRTLLPLIPVHAQDLRDCLLMGARFKVPESRMVQLERNLEKIFNRRGAKRVTPRPRDHIPVVLSLGTPEAPKLLGRLDDLSLSGVGVTIDSFVTAALHAGQKVQVSFRLGEDDEPLSLNCTVRHVRPNYGKTAHIAGFEMDARDARNGVKARRICRWMTERMLEDRDMGARQSLRRGA